MKVALVGVLASACGSSSSEPEQAPRELAFVSSRVEGTSSIWLVDEFGEGLRRLAPESVGPNDIGWSPDGGVLHFVARDGDNQDVYALDMETGAITRLTDEPGADRYPEMSPDGAMIAFISKRETGHEQIWLMDPDGGNQRRITDIPGFKARATFSPDGAWIAFQADNPNKQIWLVRPDGTDLHNISQNTHGDRYPTWSPDSTQLVFTSVRDGVFGGDRAGTRHLYRMGVDGADQRRLVPDWDHDSRHAHWSHDGELVAFDGATENGRQIFLVNADGTGLRQPTDVPTNHKPVFRPPR